MSGAKSASLHYHVGVEHDDPRDKCRCPRCDGGGTLLGHEFTIDEGSHQEDDLPYLCPVCDGTGYVLDANSRICVNVKHDASAASR